MTGRAFIDRPVSCSRLERLEVSDRPAMTEAALTVQPKVH